MKKLILSAAVPALLLMGASAFAADEATTPPAASNSGASSADSMTMSNPSVSATSQLSASAGSSPTYQGGRAAYRGKSENALNKSEAEITAQLNQHQSAQ